MASKRMSRVASAAPDAPDPPGRTMQPALMLRGNMLNYSTAVAAAQPPLAEPLVAVVLLISMLSAACVARSRTRPLHLLANDSRLTRSRSLSLALRSKMEHMHRGGAAAALEKVPSCARSAQLVVCSAEAHVAESARP